MDLVNIEARDLPDAWFQTMYAVLDHGKVFTIDRGSYAGQKRLEFDWVTIRVKQPWVEPLIPKIPAQYGIPDPVSDDYLNDYLPYLMTGELKEGESYTYGQRLCRYPIDFDYISSYLNDKGIVVNDEEIWENQKIIETKLGMTTRDPDYNFLNQIELLIWTYKNKGHRNNQMVLQIAHPTDMLLKDPPCLRHIDTRIQDNKLHFFVYFRSWSLWGGFPANLAAIESLKQYIAGEIGVENGEIIASSKGLHLYDYEFDLAKVLAMKEDMELKNGDNCL